MAHQRTADPRIRTELQERLAREKAKPAAIERGLQLAVFEAGVDDRPPESRATARFLEILESIPEEIISRTRAFPSLPEAERARLAMVQGVVSVLASGLAILGWWAIRSLAPSTFAPIFVAQAFQLLASVAVPHLLLSHWLEGRLRAVASFS